jgi:hypothetical protein
MDSALTEVEIKRLRSLGLTPIYGFVKESKLHEELESLSLGLVQTMFNERGWGNGYVCLPAGHRWWGMEYDDIPVSVHGGLTFATFAEKLDWPEIDRSRVLPDDYVIGFDTRHYGDSLKRWPNAESVMAEVNRLIEQCQ